MGDVPKAPAPTTVVLGAGYAGLAVAHALAQRSRGTESVTLVDRHPLHVLRTELYQVGRLAERDGDPTRWTIPIQRALNGDAIGFRTGEVTGIDLRARAVLLRDGALPFRSLVIALGSDVAYYGVPGAPEYTHTVYRLTSAQRLGRALRDLENRSPLLPNGRRPNVVVVGGGSTGTEVAAEIATTRWNRIARRDARPPLVRLVCGAMPFLAGFPKGLIRHADQLLARAGVVMYQGANVVTVEPGRLSLEDGTAIDFDLAVWAAGLQAPEIVRRLDLPHGHGGRLIVGPTLEVDGHPGVFAVGDSSELIDRSTGVSVPATAQVALAEAPIAAANVMARERGRVLRPFVYRERASIIAVGEGRGSGTVRGISIWGTPAGVLKDLVDREYALSVAGGKRPPGL